MCRSFWLALVGLVAVSVGGKAQGPVRVPFLDAVLPLVQNEGHEENRFEDRIETDRDAFTPTPTLIGTGRFALESAYSFIDNRGVKETHSFPEMLFRYGLSRRVELRLGWNYEVGGERNSVSGSGTVEADDPRRSTEIKAGAMEKSMSLVRESTLTYGAKIRVNDQDDWLPQSSVILVGQTPTTGLEKSTQLLAAYVIGWEHPNRWKFDAALRYATEASDGDHYNIWAPSAVLRVPVGDRVTVHGEYFGFLSRGRAENGYSQFLSGGGSYLITPDLEVGIRGGPGLNDQSAFWFVNAGFGWRF